MNPAFLTISHQLQRFLGKTCEQLSENNPAFIERAFDGRKKSIENMQLSDFCRLLEKNGQGYFDPQSDKCLLFDKHPLPKHLIDDIRIIRSFRNKYAHLKGTSTLHTNDELADMLIVQRVVKSLAGICASDNETDVFQAAIERIVQELNWQLAQVNNPDLDAEVDARGLSELDLTSITDVIRKVFAETYLPINSETDDQTTDNARPEARESELVSQLIKIDRKLTPVKGLKKQMDELNSCVISELAEIREIVGSIDERLGDDIDTELEEVEPDEWDDKGEDENSSQELRLKIEEIVKSVADQINGYYPRISSWEARDELISLRKRIWKESESGPSADGLLRKSMIDEFLYHRPNSSDEAYNCGMAPFLRSVAPEQIGYLNDVCSIVRRIDVGS